MSNNLRQIAKDLRSFVKRCKDVHYSDSLLISFLITGLLTIAPKLHADVASEQQEITAQTYDAITDLRQSFMRARKENEKSLKGAQSELVQLLRQGDQVIKSPWSSYQFGTGFTNNDWGTTYRGRGGKYLEYYRRNNDLTKYVFDANKNTYGATRLHVSRNQEPDALTINPANMHEPYKPYVPERMNNVGTIEGPTFNPKFEAPLSVNPYNYQGYTDPDPTRRATTNVSSTVTTNGTFNTNNYNALNDGSNLARTSSLVGTVETSAANTILHNNYYNWWGGGTQTITNAGDQTISGGNFEIGGNAHTHNPWSWSWSWWNWNGWNNGYSHYHNGVKVNGVAVVDGTDGAYNSYSGYSYNVNDETQVHHIATLERMAQTGEDYTTAWNNISLNTYTVSYTPTGWTSPSWTGNVYGVTVGSVTIGATGNGTATSANFGGYNTSRTIWNTTSNFGRNDVDVSILATSGTTNITKAKFLVDTGSAGSNTQHHSAIGVKSGATVNLGNTTDLGIGNGITHGGFASDTITGTTGDTINNDGNYIDVEGNTNNNGVIVLSGGTLKSNNTSFWVNGGGGTGDHHSNGINNQGGAVTSRRDFIQVSDGDDRYINGIFSNGGSVTVKGSQFNVTGSNENNGILVKGGTLDVNSDTVGNNTVRTVFNIAGTNSNGIRIDGATTTNIDYANFNVSGTNTNGILVQSGTVNHINNSNFGVSGTNTNGIFVLDGQTIPLIDGSEFTVGSTGTGILVGHSNGSTPATITSIKNTKFDVKGTDGSGTGIYLYNGNVTLDTGNTITGDKDDILVTINQQDKAQTLTFNGSDTNGQNMLKAVGNNNVAINIQKGNSSHTKETKITSGSGTANWNVYLEGANNVGVKNNYFAKKLTVKNEVGTAPTSTSQSGVMRIVGDNGVMFENLGYVDEGTLKLDAVSMNGNNSAVAAFINRGYGDNQNVDTSRVDTGIFVGDIKLQGVIGANTGSYLSSNHSVGVYANTGQRADGTKSEVGYTAGGSTSIGDLTISGLNIGLNENADNSTLIYATNGTKIDVSNSYTVNSGTGNISDGTRRKLTPAAGTTPASATTEWGYNVKDNEVSRGSVIAYAEGYLNPYKHGYTPFNSGPSYLPTEIKFNGGVDMVSDQGTALLAKSGGKITAKDVRAGGWESILAYASGGKDDDTNPSGYTPGVNNSIVKIEGQIVAADNNLLNNDVDLTNNQGTGHIYQVDNGSTLDKTYNNIGAVALNGGEVSIKGSTKATNIKESGQNAVATSSLIYGMAAYAKGKNSSVKFENDNGTYATVSVVTGIYGGLFATENGQIEFSGDMVNQNNAGNTVSTKANGVAISTSVGTRNGRGLLGYNDHRNVAPFYVKRSVEGNTGVDNSGILFTEGKTNIDMYDGILLTGNQYNVNRLSNGTNGTIIRDYYEEDTPSTNPEAYNMAKYRGMKNVTAKIMEDKHVDLGVINQIEDGQTLVWNTEGNTNTATSVTGTANYLDSIGKYYAGGMAIKNHKWSGLSPAITPNKTAGNTEVGNRFDSTILNSALTIKNGTTVNVEDVETTGSVASANKINDPFNDIKMESTLVTIEHGATVKGDAANRDTTDIYNGTNYQIANAGLSMGNSLSRWKTTKIGNGTARQSLWTKTKNTESGFINKGTVDITGGRDTNNLAALNVAFGTVSNIGAGSGNEAEIKLDHGYGIFATDGSIVNASGTNDSDSTITVTGKYTKPSTNAPTGGTNGSRPNDPNPSGSNYGIVGISKGRVDYNVDDAGNLINSIDITSTNTTIKVDGGVSLKGAATATGIFAKNDSADKDKVTVKYDDSKLTSAGIELQNAGSSASSRGVGIALVNRYANGNGGEITLTGRAGTLGSSTAADNNIFTKESGIGIYAENSDIKLTSDDFTITTKDEGVGIWTTDASNVGKGSALHSKTFNYNYDGKTDKKGFAMAFTGRAGQTDATNYLDIKFNNKGTKTTKLADEIAKSTSEGTYKGIAGIVVNTNDALDTVTNYGDIKEEKSKTHVRTYGAVVNKGTFRNFGDITLNESLSAQAKDVTSEDMKKANVGIFANDLNDKEGGKNTYIENYADIKIGDMTAGNSDKNIGSWAIYGYNIKTGKKSDGTQQTIDIARNNYGIYSGDGTVDIRGTKINVGNDTVLGHKMHTWTDSNGTVHNIDRQNGQYSQAQDLLSKLDNPRDRDSAIGVYIDSNESRSGENRNVRIDADMDIDRFSNGIVIAENNSLKNPVTTVTIGDSNTSPNILLGSNKVTGGQVKSTKPTNPRVPDEIYEQGNAVYYYSADKNSRATTWANVKMNGDYNTAYYTEGAVENHGNIDLRSQYNLGLPSTDPYSTYHGYGNVGIASANVDAPSVNYGTITTGMSDTENLQYSIGMGAGRNIYVDKTTATGKERVYDRTEKQGHVVNRGKIVVQEDDGIGMFATGPRSRAENWGTIELVGNNAIGMYLDRGAIGENHGTITGNANNLKGVLAINGGYIKNYGTIKVEGSGSNGIVTDGRRFTVDANGNRTEILSETATNGITAAQANGHGGADLYGGTESSVLEGTPGNPKRTGVETTITAPDIVPITKVSVDGIDTPVFNVDTDAANPGDVANKVTISSSIQTGGTRIIDLNTKDEWGNPAWPHRDKDQLSEVTSIGMYVDTSGVRYTNPIDGIENLRKLSKVDLYFGPEVTLYTNSKAIRIGDKYDENGHLVAKSNILKPFNDALNKLPGGAKINPLSASLTWQVLAKISDSNQLTEVYMSKIPYHSFAYDDDKSLINFTNNLDNIYEIARPGSPEKVIFNKLNSLGNGEGHILAQAFDQMRGHIYGGVQQRIKATSDVLNGEITNLKTEFNGSKDSNKFKAFGQRNEFKTDTAGMPDWYSNAGGFVFVHEDETVRLGEGSGWYAGVVNNYFTFKDLSKSFENQAMAKVGAFREIPLDANGTLTLNVGGDGFFGRTDTKRRFWVVDQEFRAKANYFTYGAGLSASLQKEFVVNDGFSIVPNVGVRAEYGRFSGIHETGDMALNVKSDDYISIKPSVGIDFKYNQPVFKNSNFTAVLALAYENEIGKVNDVNNEARIVGAWTDYFGIKGDKEDKRGNFKSDLNLGVENGRFGFTVNTGYETKGHNFKAGLGMKVLY